jgi:hypothetical protein
LLPFIIHNIKAHGANSTASCSSESCVVELLLQHRADILIVAIRQNRVIQRILPCFFIKFGIHISIIAAENRPKVVISVIKCIDKCNCIGSDLNHDIRNQIRA